MKKVAVFIGTTTGPNRVMRILEADYYNVSTVGIRIKTQKSGISRAYHDFVSYDSGVIARHTHNDLYRLDLAEEIDEGNSWNLGVFLAHKLADREALATVVDGDPNDLTDIDEVIWATGEVDADLKVGYVEEVPRKLSASNHLFLEAVKSGCELTICLPDAAVDERVSERLTEIRSYFALFQVKPMTEVSFYHTEIDLDHTETDSDAPLPGDNPDPLVSGASRKSPYLLGGALSVALLAFVFFLLDAAPSEEPAAPSGEPAAPSIPPLSMTISRTSAEAPSCFNAPLKMNTSPLNWASVSVSAAKICRIKIASHNASESPAALVASGGGVVLQQANLAPGESGVLDLGVYLLELSHIQIEWRADDNYKQIVLLE